MKIAELHVREPGILIIKGDKLNKNSESYKLAEKITELALEKKAVDVVLMDVSEFSSVTDFFVIVTGAVDVHLKAIAEHVLYELKEEKISPSHIEGMDNLSWVLMDFIDVVFHLFLPEPRKFYSMERLWGEAESIYFNQDAS